MRLTPLLAFLPVLTYAQQDDSWFQARVSFRDRYLTLAELGQRVQAKSDVPVMVDRGIAERKISVFCDGLPLGQVMRRVADTMFMEWAPEGQGLRLRLTAEAAKEERLTVLHEDEIARGGILKALDDRIALTQGTPAAFRAEAEELKASLPKLEQDTTKAGKLRYADALARYGFLSLLLYDRQLWDEGYALSQLPVERVHALLEGQPLAASTAPMPGMLRLPREALSASHLGESMPMAKDLLMIVRYDPAAHAVTFTKRSLGDENSFTSSASVIAPLESVLNREALADQPLPKHLSEWAKPLDMSVMAHPLDHEVKILPDGGEAHGWTLADNLQWLHDRTGLPIVADAFRIVASYDKPSAGDTVAGWLKNLNALRRTSPITWGVDWATGRVRTEAGWLMVRHGDFWRRLPSEIPERSLRAMEAKAAERPLALDDYANFAAGLTSTQAAALKVTSPLAKSPTYPLFGNVPVLRLWAAMNPDRRESVVRNGLSFANMSAEERLLAIEVLRSDLWTNTGSMPESVVTALISGTDLPADTTLSAEPRTRLSFGTDTQIPSDDARSGFRGTTPYQGAIFRVGGAGTTLTTHLIPVQREKESTSSPPDRSNR